VVVALHGEVIWADIFSDTELLTRYWIKLVRSYAAEGLAAGQRKQNRNGRRSPAISRWGIAPA
jgi:hypothetical protein